MHSLNLLKIDLSVDSNIKEGKTEGRKKGRRGGGKKRERKERREKGRKERRREIKDAECYGPIRPKLRISHCLLEAFVTSGGTFCQL